MVDYISRQKAIEAIMDLPNCPNGYSDTYDKECIIGTLDEVPTADVRENVHAHWISASHPRFFKSQIYKCSKCGQFLDFYGVNAGRGDANFCPNCGAEMEEKDG